MTANNAAEPVQSGADQTRLDELFHDAEPFRSADDLARSGVFDDGEVEQFLADLSTLRHADLS